MAKKLKDPQEMSFLDHLEELRWHLIRACLAVVVAASIAFLAKGFIFDVLLFGPSRIDFFTYDVLCRMSSYVGLEGGFCYGGEMPFSIQSRTMGGQFSAHIWTSITAGFIISFHMLSMNSGNSFPPPCTRMNAIQPRDSYLFPLCCSLPAYCSDIM